jgi:hypothetical protein
MREGAAGQVDAFKTGTASHHQKERLLSAPASVARLK